MKRKEVAEELHLNENDLTSWFEKKLGHLKPYATQICLGIGLLTALAFGAVYLINARQAAHADQWRELNLSLTDHRLSGNTQRLMNVAEDYPNQKAGMWSLQIAGDYDLQTGISQLSYDREGGFKVIERAKENLQKVVNASSSIKSPELQRRSLFSLAYACESLGQFEEAKGHYQQLVEAAPDSAFASPARRGAARCENDDMIALYDKFKSWEDISEDAPGPNVPSTPSLDFPDVDIDDAPATGGGGDLNVEDNTEMSSTESEAAETVTNDSAPVESETPAEPAGDEAVEIAEPVEGDASAVEVVPSEVIPAESVPAETVPAEGEGG